MIAKRILFFFSILALVAGFYFSHPVLAQEDGQVAPPRDETKTYEAKIVKIDEEKEIEVMGNKQLYQKLELKFTKGPLKNKIVIIENGNLALANIVKYKVNDRVSVSIEKDPEGNEMYNISDFIRTDSLALLFAIFIVITIFIARWKGVSSILSMGVTFLVIFNFILPQISAGKSPILIATIGSIIIIPITFYMAHGINRKTSIAVVGTFVAMLVTGIMAGIFINLTRLTGLSSEEAGFLAMLKQGSINMKGLLLAGMMIGAVGVLDDITVAQAAIVEELRSASDKLKTWELYSRAMHIGQDHITSMVNTLILVYAGASLPLLLMFIDNPHPFSEIVNYEFIAEEVIRTLVGSIGLILAVPVTTLIASILISKPKKLPGIVNSSKK